MPPTGFRNAVGTSSCLFIVLAALVWLLLPFGHPAYMATVVPTLLLGAVLAIRLLQRTSTSANSIAPWAEPVVRREMASWKRLSLCVLAVFAAFLIPAHSGFESVGNTFIWALLSARWAAAVIAAMVLALYAWAVQVLLVAVVSVLTDRHTPEPTNSKAP